MKIFIGILRKMMYEHPAFIGIQVEPGIASVTVRIRRRADSGEKEFAATFTEADAPKEKNAAWMADPLRMMHVSAERHCIEKAFPEFFEAESK